MSGYESPDAETERTGDTEQTGDTSGGDRPVDPGTPDVTDPSGVPIDPGPEDEWTSEGGDPGVTDGDATGGPPPGDPDDMGTDEPRTVAAGAGRPGVTPPPTSAVTD